MVWVYSVALTAGVLGWTAVGALFPALLAVVPFLGRRGRRRLLPAGALCAACFCYGISSTVSFQDDFEFVKARATTASKRAVELDGWVSGFPEHRLGGVRFPVEAVLDGRRVRLSATAVTFAVGYGDSVRLTGTLSMGRPDRWRALQSRGTCGYLRVRAGDIRTTGTGVAGYGAKRWAWRAHDAARRRLSRSLGARRGLPVALAIGERGWIGKRLRSVFSQLGISHLLALSGMHLGLIAGAVLALFRLVGLRGRMWLLLFLTIYVGVVGDVVSLYRAYAMAAVLIVAVEVERPAQPLGALGTALFVLLLARPGLVYSVAFQLSFVATLAVLLCVTKIPFSLGAGWPRRVATGAVSTLIVSVCVQLFLVPLLLRYFGGVSLLTPVTTVVFLPAVALLLFLDGAALATDWAWAPAATPLFEALDWTATGLERVLFSTAGWAPGLIEIPEPNMVLYYAGQAIVWLLPTRRIWPRQTDRAVVALRVTAGAVVCSLSFVIR